MCRRCETMCNEVQTVHALTAFGRGFNVIVAPGGDEAVGRVELHLLRPVRQRVPDRCAHRARLHPGDLGRAVRSHQDGRRSGGAGHPGRHRRGVRHPDRHAGHGQAGGRAAPARLRCRVRHDLRRGPDHRRRGEGDHRAGHQEREPAHPDLLLPRLDQLPQVPVPEPEVHAVVVQVAAADDGHDRQNLLRAEDRRQAGGHGRGLGDAVPRQEVRGGAARASHQRRPRCGLRRSRPASWPRCSRKAAIDLRHMPDEEFDNPLGESTGAGVIFGATGGVLEAALRTVYEEVTGAGAGRCQLRQRCAG